MKFRNQQNNIIKNYTLLDLQPIKCHFNQHFELLFQQWDIAKWIPGIGQFFHLSFIWCPEAWY